MKICNHCGAVLEDYALFCNNCGMSAKEDTSYNFEETNSQSVLEENPYEVQSSQEYVETKATAQEYDRNENVYQQAENYNPQPENFATQNMGYNSQQNNPYTQTPYATPPKPARMPVSARVLGIVGLVLGIGGAVDTIVLLLFNIFMLFVSALYSVTEIATEQYINPASVSLLTANLVYLLGTIICAVPGIVGLILGKSAIKKGNYGKTPKVAKAMGITSIIVAIVGVAISICSIIMVC